ncbi:MAG: DUF2059 domain-containing protein [Thermoanaerobaculia bacterium]
MRVSASVSILLALLAGCERPESAGEREREVMIEQAMRASRAYEVGVAELARMSPDGLTDDFAGRVRRFAADESARDRIWDSYSVIYDRLLTDEQLREVVTFYQTDAGKQLGRIHLALITAGRTRLAETDRVVIAEEETRTAASIRALAGALWAYSLGSKYRFPPDADISVLERRLEPGFMRHLPVEDGWGRPLRYLVSEERDRFRIVSGGPDGAVHASSLDWAWTPAAGPAGDDLVYEDDAFLQGP